MNKHTQQKGRKTPSPIMAAGSAESERIPDKLYFRIGDVARLLGVEAYVLRFWESEFPQLKPNKSGTGQRLYRKRDVELALRIKHLLYVDGYTIAGARQVFAAEGHEARQAAKQAVKKINVDSAGAVAHPAAEKRLRQLRGELREILDLLSAPVATTSIKPGKHNGKPHPRGGNHKVEPGLFDE